MSDNLTNMANGSLNVRRGKNLVTTDPLIIKYDSLYQLVLDFAIRCIGYCPPSRITTLGVCDVIAIFKVNVIGYDSRTKFIEPILYVIIP